MGRVQWQELCTRRQAGPRSPFSHPWSFFSHPFDTPILSLCLGGAQKENQGTRGNSTASPAPLHHALGNINTHIKVSNK